MIAKSLRYLLPAAMAGLLAGCDAVALNTSGILAVGQEDDAFTILLMTLPGEGHVELAKRYEKETRDFTGWKNVFVLHKADRSDLYWGKYRSIEEAQKNLKTAKAYISPIGMRPFTKALTVPLPGKQVGPPEWNIENVKGPYTVLIADFYDIPEAGYVGRKQFAVDYCQKLREKGVEAYYHHGTSHSAVMVGVFDESAVKVIQEENRSPRKEIQDPRVQEIIRRFPFMVNGRESYLKASDPRTGAAVRVREESKFVYIPGRKETLMESESPPPRVKDKPRRPTTAPKGAPVKGDTREAPFSRPGQP